MINSTEKSEWKKQKRGSELQRNTKSKQNKTKNLFNVTNIHNFFSIFFFFLESMNQCTQYTIVQSRTYAHTIRYYIISQLCVCLCTYLLQSPDRMFIQRKNAIAFFILQSHFFSFYRFNNYYISVSVHSQQQQIVSHQRKK